MKQRTKKAWRKWRELISEQARSGQTVTAFCRKRGLCRPYFFVWKKRLGEDTTTKFLEVHLRDAAPSAPRDTCVEIRLQNGRSLLVGRGFDRSLIVERVRAGLRNARSKGKRLGRPRKTVDPAAVAALRNQGLGWRTVAKQLGVGVGTLYRMAGRRSKTQEKVFGTQ